MLIEKKETFTPVVLTNPKIYQCPLCKMKSGTLAPQTPDMLTPHSYNCPNKFKIPVESG
jgi:hypothetical protein